MAPKSDLFHGLVVQVPPYLPEGFLHIPTTAALTFPVPSPCRVRGNRFCTEQGLQLLPSQERFQRAGTILISA